MGKELTRSLQVLAERGTPRGATAVLEEARTAAAVEVKNGRPTWQRGLGVAFGTAAAVLIVVAAALLVTGSFAGEETPSDTAPPIVPAPQPAAGGSLNDINDLALAPDGALWAATSAGVVRWNIASGGFEAFLEEDGVPGRSVESIEIAPDGTVWVVADYGVARFAGSWRVVSREPGAMVVDRKGAVWVAGESLVRYDGSWSAVPAEIDGAQLSIKPQDLAIDIQGNVWVIGGNDSVLEFDGSTWRRFTAADGIPERTRHIAVAPDGAVWAWGDGYYTGPDLQEYVPGTGFARYDGAEWTTYTVADGLLTNDGELVVGPDASVGIVHREWGADHEEILLGVSRFDGEGWTAGSAADANSYGPIEASLIDSNGMVWMPGSEGIGGFAGAQQTMLTIPPEAAHPPLPVLTFEPMSDQKPMPVATAIGDFEFTTLQPSPYRDFFLVVATPHGPVSHYGDLLSWSQDGLTWEQMPVDGAWRWITTDGADLVLFGRGFARYSWDGDGWIEIGRTDLPGEVQDIAFGHGGAVALVDNIVYYSANGIDFAPAISGPIPGPAISAAGCTVSGAADAVAGDGNGPILATDAGFVILTPPGSAGWARSPLCSPVAWFSADGRTWEQAADESPFGPDAAIRDVVGYEGRFAAIGGTAPDDGAVWVSTDGVSWQRADIELDTALTIAGGELGWFMTGNADNSDPLAFDMWFSADGLTWDGPYEGPESLGFFYFRNEPSVGSDAIFSVAGGHDGIVVGRLEQ